MSAISPPIFFQGGSPKTGYPTSPPGPSSLPKIVSDQISGDEGWMNFRFSRALPTGGITHAQALAARTSASRHPASFPHLSLLDYARNVHYIHSSRQRGEHYQEL